MLLLYLHQLICVWVFSSASLSLCPSPWLANRLSSAVWQLWPPCPPAQQSFTPPTPSTLRCRVWPVRGVGSPETTLCASSMALSREGASHCCTVEGLFARRLFTVAQGSYDPGSFWQSTLLQTHLGRFHSTVWDLREFSSFSKRIKGFFFPPSLQLLCL